MKLSDNARRLADGTLSALRQGAGSRYGLLLVGLGILLILGVTRLTDFGASMDEGLNSYMGEVFLQAYRGGDPFRSTGIEYFNGPFYFMLFTVTSRLLRSLNPGWLLTDGLHLTNYATFLLGAFFFYRIALRLLPRGVALFATALFTTQPVLFGHGFINQKDTPLMAFFLASVDLGWTAAERQSREEELGRRSETGNPAAGFVAAWKRLKLGTRVTVVAGIAVALLVLVDLWWTGLLESWARSVLGEVYAGRGPALLAAMFARIAEDAYKTPLAAYEAKLGSMFAWSRLVVTVLATAAFLGTWRLVLPDSYGATAGRWGRRWGMAVLAGVVLGMATSIRMLAPFAGMLVGAYWIGQSGRRAVPGLALYALVALVTTYLTWPVLWGNPLTALIRRTSEMSGFGGFPVHLWGVRYDSGDLPWQYLPTLLGLQLTLPALALFFLGTPYSWILSRGDRDRRLPLALIWLWLLLPAGAVVLGWLPIYNNFRHLLFALPPAFVIMGFGAWKLRDMLRAPALRAGLVALALAPGIAGIVRLHPYEYIYYNELVGGVRGASGRFNLDYWCTGFREAASIINRLAEPGDRIGPVSMWSSVAPFLREDLQLVPGSDDASDVEFALACRRGIGQPEVPPDMKLIYEVRADGALLAVVKQRR